MIDTVIYKFITTIIMRAIVSKFLLSAFIVLFAVPVSVFAQNWTAPDGPPLGNNVPPPVNVGISNQMKSGGLTVSGNPLNLPISGGFTSNLNSDLKGRLIIDESPHQPGNSNWNLVLNYLKTYFVNNFTVGYEGWVGPEIALTGQLKYKPADSLGVVDSTELVPGNVLTALDDQGTVGWEPGLPDGVENGDTLVWNTDCQCWVVGDSTVINNANLPPGSAGQTMWYNGNATPVPAWEATNKIFHDSFQTIGGTGQLVTVARTSLNSPSVVVNGSDSIHLGSPTTGATYLYSPTTVFGSIYSGVPQSVNLLPNTSLRIQGANLGQNGQGKIPFAGDDLGTYKWNDNLTYTDETVGNVDLGKLSLKNPNNGSIALFENQGLSSLWGDVVISDQGKLYLEGIAPAHWSEMGQDIIKPLCYVETTGKVVTCADDPITVAPVNPEFDWANLPTDYERLITYDDFTDQDDPQVSYTFSANQTVTVKWCGGGSGGGGGGIGSGQSGPFDYDDEDADDGGGGGGGGKAGNCQTMSVPVNENDVLTWNIGPGGAGGNGGIFRNAIPVLGIGNPSSINANSAATAGQPGGSTSVYLNGVPLGQTQLGAGNGGQPGCGQNNNSHTECPNPTSGTNDPGIFDNDTNGYLGANGANQSLPETSLLWHNGSSGLSNEYPNGGTGGDGESPSGSVSGTIPSAGGNGGIWGQVTMPGGLEGAVNGYGPGNVFKRYGGSGQDGEPGNGGGGGGGGYGQTAKLYSGYNSAWEGFTVYQRRGGNGGAGGGGYVKISGLYSSGGSNGVEEATPGQHQFALVNIPLGTSTVDVEVWGAGGGGGGRKENVLGLPNDNVGGGGGAGGYVKIQSVPVMQLCPGAANATECRERIVTLVVGQGGGEGESDSNIFNNNGVTSGSPGQSSAIVASTTTGPVNLIVAGGGQGGNRGVGGNFGAGGLGGTPSINTTGGSTVGTQQGASGATGGASAGAGHGGVGISGFGSGGQGAVHNQYGANHDSGPGAAGRIRISW